MQIHGPALREIRRRTEGKTITACAAAIGVSQPAWSQWETHGARHKRPTAANVAAILNELDIEDPLAIVTEATDAELSEVTQLRAEIRAAA